MMKRLTIILLLSILSITGCDRSNGSTPSGGSDPGGETDPGGGGEPPSGPTKVVVNKHTLSDGNPPIDINSTGQNVSKSVWNSFDNAPASKFLNNYNYTYRYMVGGAVTYETFTKNGYELSNSTGVYYYERIGSDLYYYNKVSDGYERIDSPIDFIDRRSERIAHEVDVHMFEYEKYRYYGEEDGMEGVFIYNESTFSTMVKFQGGYLTYLRYTLNSPLSTYEIYQTFESTIEIPKSYYMVS